MRQHPPWNNHGAIVANAVRNAVRTATYESVDRWTAGVVESGVYEVASRNIHDEVVSLLYSEILRQIHVQP
jgi:hypothetical protein